MTWLFISHDLSLVSFISAKAGMVNQGKLVEYGTAEKIDVHPHQGCTRKLPAAIPRGL